jgi:thiamine-phosphate diphosphorylase
MILHLVTDRHRLARGADPDSAVRCLIDQAQQAAHAGIDVIQVRERDLEGRALAQLTAAIVAVTRRTATRVVVNDRLDVALVAGADGVHLRGDSFSAARVRLVVPAGFLIGRSVRSVSDACVAGPVDYLIAGTLWPTESKPEGQPLLGQEELPDHRCHDRAGARHRGGRPRAGGVPRQGGRGGSSSDRRMDGGGPTLSGGTAARSRTRVPGRLRRC